MLLAVHHVHLVTELLTLEATFALLMQSLFGQMFMGRSYWLFALLMQSLFDQVFMGRSYWLVRRCTSHVSKRAESTQR